jgi:hypothetical protein
VLVSHGRPYEPLERHPEYHPLRALPYTIAGRPNAYYPQLIDYSPAHPESIGSPPPSPFQVLERVVRHLPAPHALAP